jgi:hypothetical protein
MPSVPGHKIKWVRVESRIRKRINDGGSIVYEARVRCKGAPDRTLTCPTLREARKQRDIARSLAWEGKHTQGAEGRRRFQSDARRFLRPAMATTRTTPITGPTRGT